MKKPRRENPQSRAKRRNANAAKRAPLFAYAGLLEEWDAQKILDDDIARALQSDSRRMETWREYVALRDIMIDILKSNGVAIPKIGRETTSTDFILERLARACAPFFNRLPYDRFKIFYGYEEPWSVKMRRYAAALSSEMDEEQLAILRRDCIR